MTSISNLPLFIKIFLQSFIDYLSLSLPSQPPIIRLNQVAGDEVVHCIINGDYFLAHTNDTPRALLYGGLFEDAKFLYLTFVWVSGFLDLQGMH